MYGFDNKLIILLFFFEIFSTSIFWVSLKLCPESLIIFSIKTIKGEVLSTVARSEDAFTWNLSVGAFNNKNELIDSLMNYLKLKNDKNACKNFSISASLKLARACSFSSSVHAISTSPGPDWIVRRRLDWRCCPARMFESEADSIIDFTEDNPFGDF